jgi:hypothetical protein
MTRDDMTHSLQDQMGNDKGRASIDESGRASNVQHPMGCSTARYCPHRVDDKEVGGEAEGEVEGNRGEFLHSTEDKLYTTPTTAREVMGGIEETAGKSGEKGWESLVDFLRTFLVLYRNSMGFGEESLEFLGQLVGNPGDELKDPGESAR